MTKELTQRVSNVKTTVVFNKSGDERYLLKMEWDNTKKSAVIIMTFPSSADELILDQTTMLCRNGAIKNGFGSISIINLTSSIMGDNPKTSKQNSEIIINECELVDCILVCFGRGTSFKDEKSALLGKLIPYKKKLFTIVDTKGLPYSHPLSPLAHDFRIKPLEIE